ncbi:class II histone deacetylase [Shewanella corallii]|uniref:Class II histone deacetylase n=1 Tax=Shewanella corallii TaxID=560080 RepID=A0ABT0N5U2_9GAMM|nr:class II histone deacetylase [Shewanella corallii]MCL2913261.1 class II histone deacetylase [Shewanella corallii]
MWHNTGNAAGIMAAGYDVQPFEHADGPETKRRIKNLLDATGMTKHLVPIDAVALEREAIERVHTDQYISKLEALDETGGEAGPFVPMGRGSYSIARLASGGLVELVKNVMEGVVDNGYALIRPAGHHAEPDQGIGFCLINNAAIAAKYAQKHYGLKRIAFVDWDVHHGNGAEAIFLEDPSVLTVSVHQDRCFPPNTGFFQEQGREAGEGYNWNFPLPPGTGDQTYIALLEETVVPLLRAYKPELIIVPCGFDAGIFDPLGRQCVTSYGFRHLTRIMMAAAAELCDGKLVFCHEGGYNASTVPYHGLAVMEELSGKDSGMDDPFLEIHQSMGGADIQPHHRALLDKWHKVMTEVTANWD